MRNIEHCATNMCRLSFTLRKILLFGQMRLIEPFLLELIIAACRLPRADYQNTPEWS